MRSNGKRLAVLEHASWAVERVRIDKSIDMSAQRLGLGCDVQELIESATFVRLEMRKANVTQPRDWNDLLYRLTRERKHASWTRMEEHGLVIDNEVLVECKATGHRPGRKRCAY